MRRLLLCPDCGGETPFEARREMQQVRCHHCPKILDRDEHEVSKDSEGEKHE